MTKDIIPFPTLVCGKDHPSVARKPTVREQNLTSEDKERIGKNYRGVWQPDALETKHLSPRTPGRGFVKPDARRSPSRHTPWGTPEGY